MRIYLAVRGEYSDFRVCHAFAREEDALAYALGDDVMEMKLREGPVEVRKWHTLWWRPDLGDREQSGFANSNPYESQDERDFDGDERHCVHELETPEKYSSLPLGDVLKVEGWSIERVRKVYSEQRAQYLAGNRP